MNNRSGGHGCITQCKHVEQHDNKTYDWRPVHESAIKAALNDNEGRISSLSAKPPKSPVVNPRRHVDNNNNDENGLDNSKYPLANGNDNTNNLFYWNYRKNTAATPR